jgi:integrase
MEMASFRQHGNGWQARVRRKGTPEQTKSFFSLQDAQKWARSVEIEIDRGTYVDSTNAQRTTMADLIDLYIAEVLPSMKGEKEDRIRLNAIKRHAACKLRLPNLTPNVMGKYRDERLTQVSAGTVIRELAYFSSIINHARREWGINIENSIRMVRKPQSPQGRNRTLSATEKQALLVAVKPSGRRNAWLEPVVKLALETAMRRGELLSLRWSNIDLKRRTALLETTKNGERRIVPLSSNAVEILNILPRHIGGEVFPVSACALAAMFDRAVTRAGLLNFRFHDLRHTAITELAKKLPNLLELSAVSGHKSLKMLQRYYHPNAEELAKKLG